MKKYLNDFSYCRKATGHSIEKKHSYDTMELEGSMPEVEIVKDVNFIVESSLSIVVLDKLVKCVKTGNMYAVCGDFVVERTESERLHDLLLRDLMKTIMVSV